MSWHEHDRVRIPIRKWEKVQTNTFNGSRDICPSDLRYGFVDDTYRLEVMINGTVLSSTVRVPAFIHEKDPERFREYLVSSLSAQIAGVVREEIRRSVA